MDDTEREAMQRRIDDLREALETVATRARRALEADDEAADPSPEPTPQPQPRPPFIQ
jgi:hypothetical protein